MTWPPNDSVQPACPQSGLISLWIAKNPKEPNYEITALFSSSINSFFKRDVWPSSGARCLIFDLTHRLFLYFMCANSEGFGETAQIRRLTRAFTGRLCCKYHNLTSWLKASSWGHSGPDKSKFQPLAQQIAVLQKWPDLTLASKIEFASLGQPGSRFVRPCGQGRLWSGAQPADLSSLY